MGDRKANIDALGATASDPLGQTVSQTADSISPPAPGPASDLPEVDPRHYDIGDEIARGGMGRLVRARDHRLGRVIALKELHQRSAQIELRFRREARITARLQHPGIVPIHEAGRWPNGAPFYAMKLLEGESLKDVIAGKATLDERLALIPNVLAVAEAIAFAHSERVIHRDLKPANIMVGAFGETVVVDWGLAKELGSAPEPAGDEPASGDGELTATGHVLGTAPYMPPEQARGLALDERADVYALGAVLYYVLTGRAPYQGKDVSSLLARVIAEPPPPLPSGVPAALAAIVDKAMARARADRYPTARELAADLRRFQAGQLVSAHDYSLGERFGRWLRRNRAAALVGTLALAALAVIAALSISRVVTARDRADAQRVVAEQRRVSAEAAEQRATERGDQLVLSEARRALDDDPARALAGLKGLSPHSPHWREARVVAADAWSRGVPRRLPGHTGGVRYAAFTQDSKRVVTLENMSGDLRFWDVAGGSPRRVAGTIWPAGAPHDDGMILEFTTWAVSPDASAVAYADSKTAQLWTGGPSALVLPAGHSPVAMSPDGSQLAYTTEAGVRLRVIASGVERLFPAARPHLLELAFTPDGRRLVGNADGTPARLFAWRLSDGQALSQNLGDVTATNLAVHPASDRVAVGDSHGRILVWHLAEDRLQELGHYPSASLDYQIELTPDGKHLLAAGEYGFWRDFWLDGSRVDDASTVPFRTADASPDGNLHALADKDTEVIRLVDRRQDVARVFRRASGTRQVAFSPDGQWLLGYGSGNAAELWSMASPDHRFLPGDPLVWVNVHDGKTIALLRRDHGLALWDGDAPVRSIGVAAGANQLVASRDGRWLATAGTGGIQLWPVAGGAPRLLTRDQPGQLIGFSADGAVLGMAADRSLQEWPQEGGGARAVCGGGLVTVVPSPDATRVMTWEVATRDNRALSPTISLCALASGQVTTLAGHRGAIAKATFSADGGQVASSSDDASVRIWDLSAGTVHSLAINRVQNLRFVDRTHLAVANDVDVSVWDLATDSRRILSSGGGHVVETSPDGTSLLTTDAVGDRWLWDVATWQSRRIGPPTLIDIGFAGAHAIGGTQQDGMHLYRDDLPDGAEALQRWLAAHSNAILQPDGTLVTAP